MVRRQEGISHEQFEEKRNYIVLKSYKEKEIQAPGEADLIQKRKGTACFTDANVCDRKLSTSVLNRKRKIPSLDGLPKITQ